MITVIIIIVLIIISKFIYDSYLTSNTEKRWSEFKSSNPLEASKVENSSLGVKSSYSKFPSVSQSNYPGPKRYSKIVEVLNKNLLDSKGIIKILDGRSFKLYSNYANCSFVFRYAMQELTLTMFDKSQNNDFSWTKNYNENQVFTDQTEFASDFVKQVKYKLQERAITNVIKQETQKQQSNGLSIPKDHEKYIPNSKRESLDYNSHRKMETKSYREDYKNLTKELKILINDFLIINSKINTRINKEGLALTGLAMDLIDLSKDKIKILENFESFSYVAHEVHRLRFNSLMNSLRENILTLKSADDDYLFLNDVTPDFMKLRF
ncbi:hypothetical protein [Sediminibacter sp. Hel_I_10]|uniref:hypothetical protein n=1 Tax=Sediminibacter sp. Hel_I_10 TaxID=1392490 RepID=UPI00047DCFD6|nr:hypothetical protein [Sediminibacter sp. Hel_I_10]